MIYKKIISLCFLVCIVLALSGCGSEGGGGGLLAFLSEALGGGSGSTIVTSGGGSTIGGGSIGAGTTPLATVHNPEPSSLMLLASGLVGMGLRARAKLRKRSKK